MLNLEYSTFLLLVRPWMGIEKNDLKKNLEINELQVELVNQATDQATDQATKIVS